MRKIFYALALLCAFAIPSPAQDPQETRGPGAPTAQSPVPDCIQFKKYRDTLTGNIWASVGLPCQWVNPSLNPSGMNISMPSGLIGWYPLTEATGVAPVDISGNGNNTTLPGGASNPTGTPYGWQFSTTGNGSTAQYFTLPAAINTSGLTYVAHVCPRFLIDYNNPVVVGSDTAGGVLLGFLGATTTKNAWQMSIGLSGVPVTRTAQISIGCHVFTWEIGATDHMFVDGVETTYVSQGSDTSTLGVGSLKVGTSYLTGGAAGAFSGTLRDLWVFNRLLSTSEVATFAATAARIAQQQGVQQYSPLNSATPGVVCLGDSITAGLNVTNAFCSAVLLVPTETVAITNLGLSGVNMSGITGTAAAQAYPYFAANARHNTATLFACTNDFVTTPNVVTSAAICEGLTASAARQLRQAGFKVILVPMLSRTAQDTNKDSLDALYNSNWQQYADAYISPTDANLWADGASANGTYFQGDATHPTQTGQNLLGGYATNAYNKLWGSTSTAYNSTAAATYTLTAADSYLKVTANSTLTLPSCKGYSGTWTVKVNPGLTVTLKTAAAAETIDGVDRSVTGLSLTAGATSAVTVVPSAPAAATCTWQQTQ